MSAPGRYDFVGQHAAYRGATLARTFTWTQPNGTPVGLAGWSAAMQVRASADAAGVLLTASSVDGRLAITSAVGGVVTLTIPAAVMAALVPGRYVYDIKLSNEGTVVPFLGGMFDVMPDVTR